MKIDKNAPIKQKLTVDGLSQEILGLPVRVEIAVRLLTQCGYKLDKEIAKECLRQADTLIDLHNDSLEQ